MSIFISLLILSLLIFFHELGHFLVAKYFGVKIEVFSIGFGKKLYKKVHNGTEYCISAIPLGGYVQMKGQDDLDPTRSSQDEDSYNAKSPWQRIGILLAGPGANFLLAFLLYIVMGIIGVDKLAPVIGKVYPDSPAFKAKLQKGDKILQIDKHKIVTWDDIKNAIKEDSKQESIIITVKRGDKIIKKRLTPRIESMKNIFNETVKRKIIGILPSGDIVHIKYSFLDSFKFAYQETLNASRFILKGLEKMIEGVVPAKEMGGVISIVQVTSQAASAGIVALLGLTALISVNLGILNLFPIPALDGGHIVFNLYEIIFKKPPNENVMYKLTYAGWAILLSLMLFSTYNDINRLIEG
ncbi:MAG: RIP metalloprotease RseP [Epsilonproteobacteria bacterium]|nr:RIP metalloprotease RseP [Campylobacterota bacterium]